MNSKDKELKLSCEHYEHELSYCSYFNLTKYFQGEEMKCDQLKLLLNSCLSYKKDKSANSEDFKQLKAYETSLNEKRRKQSLENDTWKLRQSPPSDWNSKLPQWAEDHIKESSWFKESQDSKS
jgi:hypothetical protein